jgi:multiple sugar transport system substrate-binding protein
MHILGVGTGAAGVGTVLASCAPTAEEEAAPATASATESPAASSAAGPATFGFASWGLNEEAAAPVIEGLLDAYSSGTGDTLETVSYPYNEYLNQLTLQVRGGQFTGAAQLDINWLGALAQLGVLRDMSDYAAEADYTDAALASGQLDGVQLGLPWTTGSIGLIANRQILDTAGVGDTFATIEDFEAALNEIKASNPAVIPFGGMTAVDQLKDILAWMMTFGSPVVENGDVTLGDEGSVAAVEFWKRLYDAELIPPALNRFDARALFAQGGMAMYEDAIVGRGAVASQAAEGFADLLVPIARPAPSGGSATSLLWGHLVVVVEGEGSEAAAALASQLTGDPEVAVGYFEELGLPPTTETALADPAVVQDEYTTAFTERITADAVSNPLAAFPASTQLESVIAEQVQRVLVGEASAQEAMDAAAEGVRALI